MEPFLSVSESTNATILRQRSSDNQQRREYRWKISQNTTNVRYTVCSLYLATQGLKRSRESGIGSAYLTSSFT